MPASRCVFSAAALHARKAALHAAGDAALYYRILCTLVAENATYNCSELQLQRMAIAILNVLPAQALWSAMQTLKH